MNTPFPSYQEITGREALAFKAGQLFMPAAFINDTEEAIRDMEALIREYHIGGLCFFHSPASAATNFEGAKEIPHNPDSLGTLKSLIARYQRAARYPLLIAIDAEWGLAMRIENGEAYPYALTLGALKPGHPLVYQTGLLMAEDCRKAGIHWNLAPVVDVNINPKNPVIGYRAFGSDPASVALHALTFYKGLRDGGLLGCAKHFPGHGDTDVDSHLELPSLKKSRAELENAELLPFRRLIEEGVDAVMTGHLAVPELDPAGMPASLSEPMIRGLLRSELGFKGPVVTDALNMHAVQKKFPGKGELAFQAFSAGNDMLCFAEEIPEAIGRITSEAPQHRVEEAFERIWSLKERTLGTPIARPDTGRSISNEQVIRPQFSPSGLKSALAAECLTLLKGEDREVVDGRDGTSLLPDSINLLIAGAGLQVFEDGMLREFPMESSQWNLSMGSPGAFPLPKQEHVLLALCPPSIKPKDRFGIPPRAVEALNRLLKERNVYLCHFGNPYALELFHFLEAAQVLIAYQDLEEFQQEAVKFYRGKSRAPGKLPVPVKSLSI